MLVFSRDRKPVNGFGEYATNKIELYQGISVWSVELMTE